MKKNIKTKRIKSPVYLIPKALRTLECFSMIMYSTSLENAKTHASFLNGLISSKKEIDAYLEKGELPKRVLRRLS